MGRTTLSRASLRRREVPKPPPDGTLAECLLDALAASQQPRLSRRDLLKFGGAATVGATAFADTALAATSRTAVTCTPARAQLHAGGRVLRVETSRFAGTPRLTRAGDAERFALRLSGATYPGTTLPADFVLHVDASTPRPRMRLELALLGIVVEAPLVAWLEGKARARARVDRAHSAPLGKLFRLRLEEGSTVEVRPDLGLVLEGPGSATIEGPDTLLTGDRLTLWLAEKTSPTSLTRRLAKRTMLQLHRGDAAWKLPSPDIEGRHSIGLDAETFDLATVECAETAAAGRVAVLTADDLSGSGLAWARAGATGTGTGCAGIAGADCGLAGIPLARPRLAIDCDTGEFAVEAQAAEAATWLHAPGQSLLVGPAANGSALSARGRDCCVEKVAFAPRLIGVAAPFEDVLATPILFDETQQERRSASLTVRPLAINPFPPPVALDAASITITRPEDMLSLKFEFFNLKLVTDASGQHLTARDTQKPSYLVAQFPPQAVLEEAYFAESASAASALLSKVASIIIADPKRPPIQARIAAPTRLAFVVPSSALAGGGIPFTLEGLLDWVDYSHSVAPGARDRVLRVPLVPWDRRAPEKGTHTGDAIAPETAIEAPWGVTLSPSEHKEYWKHRSGIFRYNEITELWHTSLTGRTINTNPRGGIGVNAAVAGIIKYEPGVRVVWARGYGDEAEPSVDFRNSFTTDDIPDITGMKNRKALVDLTTIYQHDRVDVRRLSLTTLGAWLDLKGSWPTADYMAAPYNEAMTTALEAWDNRSTMGRDHFVRIVKAGRLFPWGHRASMVTITERKYANSPDGHRTAYLMQRMFIIVREVEKSFESGTSERSRANPYKTITFKTRITPDLKQATQTRVIHPLTKSATQSAFWPHLLSTGESFKFAYTALDWDGNVVELSSPLIWIAEEYAAKVSLAADPQNPPPGKSVLSREMAICSAAFSQMSIPVNGQLTAYCEKLPAGAKKDRRTLETRAVRFDAENFVESSSYSAAPNGTAHFYPRLYRALVRLQDVEALMNTDAGTWIELWDGYLAKGFLETNYYGKVFAEISNNGSLLGITPVKPLALDIPPDKAGGFATPNVAVRGLSASHGPFGGDPKYFGSGIAAPPSGASKAAAVAPGEVDPLVFFAGADPELFGGITLGDILRGVGIPLDKLPLFNDFTEQRGSEAWAVYEYKWQTDKFGTESEIFIPKGNDGVKADLYLRAYLEKNLTKLDAPPSSGVEGKLRNFTLSLFGVIEVEFTHFGFSVANGTDVSADPKINDIRFAGELAFVNQLRELMNFTSEDGGFALDIDGSGLSAMITIALPDVAIGVMSLKNMSISAGLKLPFDGTPLRFPFAFCSREKPFELTVSGIGGGGYFLVELQASEDNAIAMLELSLEFGLACSVSLCGIASGGVEIKGGFALRIEGDALSFKAFFRMGGYLSILGIISASIVFLLNLEYKNKQAAGGPTSLLIGTASLTIDIEICFFSFSVDLTVSKEFEGDDPRFGDWMDPGEWATYCDAFGPAKLGA